MPTLSDLLNDPTADVELIVKGVYKDQSGITHISWFSQSGWQDLPDGPAGVYIEPLLDINLTIDKQINPLETAPISSDVIASINLINDSIYRHLVSYFDSWRQYNVDGLEWLVYAVGRLSTGLMVQLSDVVDSPLHTLIGIGFPEVGSSTCEINTRSKARLLETALQPVTYSPPCLLFPGTSSGYVDLGNNLNITGVQTLSFWIYVGSSSALGTAMYLVNKDSGTTGYYVAVGSVAGGTIEAGVEVGVRGMSPFSTNTSANVIRAHRWTRVDIIIGTTNREIVIDGASAINHTGLTGTPTATAVSLKVGMLFLGRLSRLLWWSTNKTVAALLLEARIPIIGNEANLREAFLLTEGSGSQVESIKTGSSLTGTLTGSGVNQVLWDTATWHYDAILGQQERLILGFVPRSEIVWIDPPRQIGHFNRGTTAVVTEVQINHSIVNTANYTVNLNNSTIQITTGALSGTYSLSACANNFHNSALLFSASSRAVATISNPTGSRTIGIRCRPDTTNGPTTTRVMIGWIAVSGGGMMALRTQGANVLNGFVSNDAGSFFQVNYTRLEETKNYTATLSLNVSGSTSNGQPNNTLWLYVNGNLEAQVAVSGAFTATINSFGVGIRSFDLTQPWVGRLDEAFVFNREVSELEAQTFHLLPLTGSESGLVRLWHMDDATGSSASASVGGTALTLTSITWTYGRCAAADLGRMIFYMRGYTSSDLDFDSWLGCLNDNPDDNGWQVSNGIFAIECLKIILGGLGFILHESVGKWYVDRFEGVSGVAEVEPSPDNDVRSELIESEPGDPPIYEWIIRYSTNNAKINPSDVDSSLASTDPGRFNLATKDDLQEPKTNYEILAKYPSSAQSRSRLTALVTKPGAAREAGRLLPIHENGADRKRVPMFNVSGLDVLTEIGPLVSEAGIDDGNMLVVGVNSNDGIVNVSVWKPR